MAIWSPPRPSTTGSGGLDRYFHVTERGSTIRTEVIAGAATWLTMAYIIFVNPAIIGSIPDRLGNFVAGGKQFDAAQVAAVTALVAGVLTLLMGAYANYPFAMAAGLGLNAFVTFTLVGTFHLTWPQAMGVIVWEGLCITVLVLTRFREYVMNAIPLDLKRAIGVGIGAFIAFIGLRNAGIVVKSDARDEGADAHSDGAFQVERDGVHHVFAEAGQDEDRDAKPLPHDDPHRLGPREMERAHQREGDEGIQPEPRRHREGVVRVRAHQQCEHAGHECRDRRHLGCVELLPTGHEVAEAIGYRADDRRVDEDDVGHR